LLSQTEEADSYMMSLPRRREVVRMVAWEELFMFCTLIIQIIALIIAIFQHKRNNRPLSAKIKAIISLIS
jgi:hypothetical protein